MSQTDTMELEDYLAILRKRKIPFLLTFLIILIIGVVVAFTLPPTYRSEATILIEKQEIPENLVATTVTGYVQERIEGIRQKLITYENLREIAEQADLYPEIRESGDMSELVKTARRNIKVAMVDVKTSGGGRGQTATVAFTVGFLASTPEMAKRVANLLAERYLEENKLARSEQAAEVSSFLEQEANKLRLEIEQLEKALAKFKQEQADQLPELLQVNMRLFEKTEGQIENTRDRILKIEDQITALQAELSLTPQYKAVRTDDGKLIMSPAERLNALTLEFLQKSVRYAPTHPDMIRLTREIESLGSQSTDAAKVSDLVQQLTLQKSKLLEAEQKYSAEHPDVQSLKKSVNTIENQLRSINIQDAEGSSVFSAPPDNPRYVTLKTQLDTAISNLKEEQTKLKLYNEKLREYEKRLFQTPIVEREYQALTRDYGNAKKKYTELKDKQLEARMAEQLEAGEKGQRFVLQGPALMPSSPDSPNRLGIILLSGLLAFGGGIGALAVAEFRDRSISGPRGVADAFGTLPIAVIPYIENRSDKTKTRYKQVVWFLGFVLIIAGILGAIHVFWMPLGDLISG